MPRRRAALAGSLLLHVMAVCVVMLWVAPRPPTPPATEQPIEMVFRQPAEPAPELPQAPPTEVAPTPPDALPTPEPQATAPPVPLVPTPPPVDEAPALPSVPTPFAPAVEPAEEAPRSQTKPSPTPVQPRPVIRARPAAREPATAAPPSPVPAPAPAPVEAPPIAISAAWRQELSAWLAAHKSYPEAARRRGEEGSVALRFTVERSGRVTEVSVVRGSGSSILDAAAEAMLRNAIVPAFAGTMSQEWVVVNVQVRFALTD